MTRWLRWSLSLLKRTRSHQKINYKPSPRCLWWSLRLSKRTRRQRWLVNMKKGYTYILECSDGSYYTGSTIDLELRLQQHQNGAGSNHTKKRLPVKLVYMEVFTRIDEAFYREKQIQGWSRKKKEALINGEHNLLPKLSMAYRDIEKDK